MDDSKRENLVTLRLRRSAQISWGARTLRLRLSAPPWMAGEQASRVEFTKSKEAILLEINLWFARPGLSAPGGWQLPEIRCNFKVSRGKWRSQLIWRLDRFESGWKALSLTWHRIGQESILLSDYPGKTIAWLKLRGFVYKKTPEAGIAKPCFQAGMRGDILAQTGMIRETQIIQIGYKSYSNCKNFW